MEKDKLIEALKLKIKNSRTREQNAYNNYSKLKSFEEGYRQAIDEIEVLYI